MTNRRCRNFLYYSFLLSALVPLISSAEQTEPQSKIPYFIYVTNEVSGDVTVIDGLDQKVIDTILLGKRPRGIAADPLNQRIFVALSGSPMAGPGVDEKSLPPPDKSADGIGIVDTRTRRVEQVLRGVSDPEQVTLSPDGRRLYVASEDAGKAVVIDVASGKLLAQISVGAEPEGVAVNPQRAVAYFTSEVGNSVAVVDTIKFQLLRTVPVGQRPRDVEFSPDGMRAYVTGEVDASLSVLDGQSDTVIKILRVPGDGARPKGIAVSQDGRRIYISTGRGGQIVAFDTTTWSVLGFVQVGARPWGLALSPDGRHLYSANGPSDDVSVVATQSLRVEATIKVGKRPWGIAVLQQR
jgi:YVTN family beta-propeller protein